jgi:hypothetical protein
MLKHFFLALSFLLLVSSCSKNSSQTKSMTEMLRTGRWKISGANVKLRLPSGLDTTLNLFRFMPSCKTGVYLVFDSFGVNGNMYTGTPCNAGDPTEINFQWNLTDNNTILNLYNGFNLVYAITDTVLQPVYFDTLVNNVNASPPLVLDSVVTAEDTGYIGFPHYLVLDSMWNLKFDSIPDPYLNINGQISNFSQSSFTLTFAEISVYPDSTLNHASAPIYRPDTVHFTFIFNNF